MSERAASTRGPAPTWRLLRDDPGSGAWNMAVDEALLDSHARDAAGYPATLRLYGWEPATLSFGRGQPARFDAAFLHARGIGLVRRPTGGLAVLHDAERTYALVAALRRGAFPGGVLDTYRRVAAALEDGLRRLGVQARSVGPSPEHPVPAERTAACFGLRSAHEIAVGGQKLVGSAQLRRRGSFLQHGSIVLRADPLRTAGALGLGAPPACVADIEGALGRVPRVDEIDAALVDGFSACQGIRFEVADLTPTELERATQLYSWKYTSLAWTLEGRPGSREAHWGPA